MKSRFYGVYTALLTPFDERGEIDERKLRRLVNFLLSKKINGFYLCGGAGEGIFMDVEERKRVAEIVQDEVKEKAKIIVHVGTYNTKNAVELARHAERIDVDAISSLPPLYYYYSEEEVLNYYREVADSTTLPFFLYYIPATTRVVLTSEKIVQLGKIKNIMGLKYTHSDFYLLQEMLLRMEGRWIAFSGADELFLPALTMGVIGSIGSTQNVLPEIFVDIYEKFKQGRIQEAMELQKRITTAVSLLKCRHTGLVSWKTALKFRGIDAGHCRAPLRKKFSPDEEKELLKRWKYYFPEFVEV
ncbi:MAG TPA: dihydrodipicolinate synthase family protein [Candidatus Omnitrophica bacterium]|nr:dihydrodipicolinate synthase family protein [Candidatus Omnitrophota bacterium]